MSPQELGNSLDNRQLMQTYVWQICQFGLHLPLALWFMSCSSGNALYWDRPVSGAHTYDSLVCVAFLLQLMFGESASFGRTYHWVMQLIFGESASFGRTYHWLMQLTFGESARLGRIYHWFLGFCCTRQATHCVAIGQF